MKKFKNFTLIEYLKQLSQRVPTPGGGSASALSGAMGAALIAMVARYSIGRSKTKSINTRMEKIVLKADGFRDEFLAAVDLDAEAYMKVVNAREGSRSEKKQALREARKVPLSVCKLCYKTIQLTPYLVENGNPHLLSDVDVACDMLLAAFNGAMTNVEVNS